MPFYPLFGYFNQWNNPKQVKELVVLQLPQATLGETLYFKTKSLIIQSILLKHKINKIYIFQKIHFSERTERYISKYIKTLNMKKIRTGTMLYPSTIKLCDKYSEIANVDSRNNFIEKAIHFYVGYLDKDNNINYLNESIHQTITNNINLLEDRLSKTIFKLTIELCILTKIIAATHTIDEKTLDLIRTRCIFDVKETNGKLDLKYYMKQNSNF